MPKIQYSVRDLQPHNVNPSKNANWIVFRNMSLSLSAPISSTLSVSAGSNGAHV